jgi:nicotinamidase-related amidase
MSRSRDSVFWPGQAGAEFQDAFSPLAAEHVLEKNVTDAFANSGLEQWLRVRNIEELVIVGVSTNMSVEATARSAGNLGFRAFVVSDATFTFDRADLTGKMRTAEEIHLMSLTNLSGEYAKIVESSALPS